MNCPKCGKLVDHVIPNSVAAIPGSFPKTIQCVAYCCPNVSCGCILGVESNPDVRDSTMRQLEKNVSHISKTLDEEATRRSVRALAKAAKQNISGQVTPSQENN